MESLNIGLIGAGHRNYFINSWVKTDPKIRVKGLAEIDDTQISWFKKNINSKTFVTKNYKELLTRDNIDALVVLTPDYLHKEQTLNILKAKKHVYLEKPMALTIEDCDEILEAWKKSNQKLMIGFNMRYMKMYQKMKNMLDNNIIGELKQIIVYHYVGSGGEKYFQTWHRNQMYSNSLLIHKGSHDIDMIHMLAGSYTRKVSAFGGLDFYDKEEHFQKDNLTNYTNAPIDVEDNNVVIMELENGIKASYLQCHFTPEYSRRYTLIGTEGVIESNDLLNEITIKINNSNSLIDTKTVKLKESANENSHFQADEEIVKGFKDYILNDKDPNASPLDAKMSVAVGHAATKSLRNYSGVEYVQK